MLNPSRLKIPTWKYQKEVEDTQLDLGGTSELETKIWSPSAADAVDYPTTMSPFLLANCTPLFFTCGAVMLAEEAGPQRRG